MHSTNFYSQVIFSQGLISGQKRGGVVMFVSFFNGKACFRSQNEVITCVVDSLVV